MSTLSQSDINHLRRLLGYVRCEIGQEPDEVINTVRGILPYVDPDDEGKERLVKIYQKSVTVPKYVRAAIKALEKHVRGDGRETDEDKAIEGYRPRLNAGERVE